MNTNFGLHYAIGSYFDLVGYVDLDLAGYVIDCKSTWIYVLYLRSYLICWLSKNKSTISLSCVDVEYKGAINTTTKGNVCGIFLQSGCLVSLFENYMVW